MLVGAGIFLIIAPVIFAALAVAISLLQGCVILAGSVIVSIRHRRWESWVPEWTVPDWFGDGF